jgi:hypothetical protein
MASDDLSIGNLNRQLRILGACWLVYGFIGLATALWLFTFTNTATVMFGALLNRVPNPFTMMSDFHFIYGLAIVFFVACGLLGVLAGLALLAGQRYGRAVALIASFLSLSSIPLGTTLGIYSLIILLPLNAARTPATVETQSSNLKRPPVRM